MDLKYSAIAVALLAPLIRSNGDLSAGTATTIVLFFASPESIFFTKLPTSRPRSPISPTTTISASVYLHIIPSKTDFPTPDPAIKPTLCPLPTGNKLFIALTPTSSGLLTEFLDKGFKNFPFNGHVSLNEPIGFPS